MNERGMVKWTPFNSIMQGESLVNEIEQSKSKKEKPTLSPDQIQELNENLTDSYYNKNKVVVEYYSNGRIYKKEGIITSLNQSKKYITVNNNYSIHTAQIIRIKI